MLRTFTSAGGAILAAALIVGTIQSNAGAQSTGSLGSSGSQVTTSQPAPPTTSPDPTPTTSPTPPPTTPDIPAPTEYDWASLDEVLVKLADPDAPVNLTVVGDSTGAWINSWVGELARHISATYQRPARLNIWREGYGGYYYSPLYGNHLPGTPVEIWSGSEPGAGIDWIMPRLDRLVAAEPDLVLVNLGHNDRNAPLDEMAVKYDQLHDWLATEFGTPPALIDMIQNPRTADPGAYLDFQEMLRDQAELRGALVVDADAAFRAVPDWETALLMDGVHPNDDGYRVWAEALYEAMGI